MKAPRLSEGTLSRRSRVQRAIPVYVLTVSFEKSRVFTPGCPNIRPGAVNSHNLTTDMICALEGSTHGGSDLILMFNIQRRFEMCPHIVKAFNKY